MDIYCWGNNLHGELGFDDQNKEQILVPEKLSWKPTDNIIHIACGLHHTLFLTSDGKVYSCGSNDAGQLGLGMATKRPQLISEMENYFITQICCGSHHSLAISEWGQVFSWGKNNYGQLAQGNTTNKPKIVKHLASKNVIQVACGFHHCLALTNCGEVYAWGSNIYGELGVTTFKERTQFHTPFLINALQDIPITFIASGGYHCFAVSKSGGVFAWGRNQSGQLGLNDNENRSIPTQLKNIRNICVRYIACGGAFSVFLTNDGGVFTCGNGIYGQLGHGSTSDEVLPRKVMELMGSTVTQISCGINHALAVVPSRGRIYSFGNGTSGQLGVETKSNSSLPQTVLGPWVPPDSTTLSETPLETKTDDPITIRRIFSGSEQSLVIVTALCDNIPAVDFRCHNPKTQILSLTCTLAKQCSLIGKNESIDMDLLNTMELMFTNASCLNGSFYKDQNFCCNAQHHGVDLTEAETAFNYLRKMENEGLKDLILDKITNELLPSLNSSPTDLEALRIFLILPLYHEFVNSKNYEKLHTSFGRAMLQLKEFPQKVVAKWWSQTSNDWYENMVYMYKNAVAHIISFKMAHNINGDSDKRNVIYNAHLSVALNILIVLYRINTNEREDPLHYEAFYWPELVDYVDIQQDYIRWLFDKNPDSFNLCNYPFLFNASAKTTLLQTDQAIQMHNAMHNASTSSFLSMINFGSNMSRFIVLNVSRENLVEDTLREIMQYNQSDLKKPLKIRFYGEEAEDAGGVRKEFFMLLLKDLIDPKYGMFKEYDDSHVVWFADATFETEDMYLLIGVICGLAIYNFTIINLPFPLALYKKLLDEPVDLNDLRTLSPTIANSLQSLLDYEDDNVGEVFDLYFEVTREIFGVTKCEPLKPSGHDIQVTKENRSEFVELYIDFVFNTSVQEQFTAFQKGFMKVCWGRVLQIFKPIELMAVVVGNEEYDWQALELNCEYRLGYSANDSTVKWFWEVFHELPLSEKKKFLLFLTGSDRIPIQGMKAIKIAIQPTFDERFLPAAHTCFNLLDLPRYKTKERLKFKLMQSIQQTQGFSLV